VRLRLIATTEPIGLEIDVPNAKALRDGGWVAAWIRANPNSKEPVPLYIRNGIGGTASIAGLVPQTYSACVIPIPDPGAMA
jgi:hypothetical protein